MTILAPVPDEVQLLREEIAHLRTQIAWLKQPLFGPGKSETLDRAQLLLKLGALERLAATERPVETIRYGRPQGPGIPRTRPAENFVALPVKETVELVPAAVQAEPELYEKIGEERTFEVDVTPPKLFKREIIRPRYRHRLDKNRAPLVAPAPARAVAPWPAVTPRRDCSRGAPSANTSIICRSTGWNRCRGAGAPGSPVRPWPTGSDWPRSGWSRFTG